MDNVILGVVGSLLTIMSSAGLGTALKTWRDVALIKADHIPSREIIARLTVIEVEIKGFSRVLRNCPNCKESLNDDGNSEK